MSVIPHNDPRVAQLIDANLDRAREGLRVIEDWCRFVLKRKDLVVTIKNFRQILGIFHQEIYKKARSTASDNSIGLNHPAQNKRSDAKEVVLANFARVQEALRVLEEFCRQSNPELSKTSAEIRYEIYDLEITLIEATNSKRLREKLQTCKLCLITSPHTEILNTISIALKAGVKMVQYREKEGNDSEKISLAKKIFSLCKKHKSLFIINDRIDIALAVEADGVHLGQKDIAPNIARKLLGQEKLIGLSTHSIEEVIDAQSEDIDYIGAGPIYKTNTKPHANSLGLKFLSKASKISRLPLFAIGGINSTNLSEVLSTGASKIAIISAIMDSNNPKKACHSLLEELQ